jgi:putative phosphoesterase
MPSILILSDIHGNLPSLEAVLADARQSARQFAPLDAILVAGDIITPIYHETLLQKLRDLQAVMIQGNGEKGLLEMEDGSAPAYYWTAQQFALARWCFANVTKTDLEFIRTLPEQRTFHLPGTDPIRMVHGSPRKINESIFPSAHPEQLAEVLALVDEPVVIFGHTHQPWQVRIDGRLALNPGAVTGPLDGQVGAQYAILDWDGRAWQARLRCVPYDLQATDRIFQDSGLLETGYLARSFLISIHTGQNGAEDFLTYAFELSRQAGFGDLPYLPDEIWEQAGASFPWPSYK